MHSIDDSSVSELTLLPFSIESIPSFVQSSSSQSSSKRRIRGSASSPATKSTANTTTTTKSTGPYDCAFEQNLVDAGIYPSAYRYANGQAPPKPKTWQDISERLAQPRASLSPSRFSDAKHEEFVQLDAHASKEKQITTSVIPMIEGQPEGPKCVSGGIVFTNLDHLTDGTLKPGKPDLYYGARPEKIARRVRSDLNNQIQPTIQNASPIGPNFFLAAKGPDGSGAVAKRQACYDGALGARGLRRLQSYGQKDLHYDGNAYTITSSYSDGQLKMYTSHPTQISLADGRPEYTITQINTWGLTGNPESFRQGARALRNARDFAKEHRDNAINLANACAKAKENSENTAPPSLQRSSGLTSNFNSARSDEPIPTASQHSQTSLNIDSQTTGLLESESSMDELALDFKPGARSTRKRSKRPRR